MNTRIKILYVHHGSGIGGASLSLINLLSSLNIEKFEATVLLLQKSDLIDELNKRQIKWYLVESIFYRKFYKYFVHSEADFYKWYNPVKILLRTLYWTLSKYFFSKIELQKFQVEIIHLNSSVLIDWLYSSKKSSKTVIHIREPFAHGYFGIRKYFLVKNIDNYADKIIAISEDNSNRIGLKSKTIVVYNFLNINLKPNLIKYDEKKLKVLYLGGDFKIKGFQTIVESLRFLDDQIVVWFCGSLQKKSENKRDLKFILKIIYRFIFKNKQSKLYKELYNSKNVKIIGFVNNPIDYIASCDLIVSPFSVPHFSRPVIEGFLFGKPSIGTNVIGMNELIIDKFNGYLFPKNDSIALANLLNSLKGKNELLFELGNNGRQRALNLFTSKNILIIENIYTNLTSN